VASMWVATPWFSLMVTFSPALREERVAGWLLTVMTVALLTRIRRSLSCDFFLQHGYFQNLAIDAGNHRVNGALGASGAFLRGGGLGCGLRGGASADCDCG